MKFQLVILSLTFCGLSFSQIDKSDGNTFRINGKIGTFEGNGIPLKKPASLELDKNYNGFKTAKKELDKNQKKKDQEQAIEKKGIITPKMVAKQNFQKNIEGFYFDFPQIDMDLGSFHTKSKNAHISSYDFGRFDGDKVQITVNGKRIHNNYLLTPKIKTISFPLKIGINKIEVTALNEGELKPNTGYFNFFDDNRNTIKEGQWMLASGAKVIAIIVREDD